MTARRERPRSSEPTALEASNFVQGVPLARIPEHGSSLTYGALLPATGAEPVPLTIAGSDLPHVHCLRTQADGGALVAAEARDKPQRVTCWVCVRRDLRGPQTELEFERAVADHE